MLKMEKRGCMAKKGLDISTIQAVLKDVQINLGWSLCIGAGTSVPALPDWFSLVERLINHNCCPEDKIDIDVYRGMGFSADAMIQAVRNRLHISDDEFIHLLSEEVYASIRDKISLNEWQSFIKVHEAFVLSGITDREWRDFEKVKDCLLIDTSANLLAEVVVEAIRNDQAPKAILTFNGEAVFLALLNYYWINRTDNKNKFDRIINGISYKNIDRIPYIHCHGVLPINDAKPRKGRNANEKLVFLEESYLQLANSPMSWQAINFIENCMQSKMVFVGVSLSDPNMRRWLGWIHNNKVQELKSNGIAYSESTEHFWINKKPESEVERVWVEESVAHLGVRLVWIDEWNQVGIALKKMLAL